MPVTRRYQRSTTLARVIAILLLCVVGLSAVVRGQTAVDPRMLSYLQQKVSSNPEDASSWRLLGRAYLQAGETQKALTALNQAIKLAPESAAGHFDRAGALEALGREKEAAESLQRVLLLAPESDYAGQAREKLPSLPATSGESDIIQAGYEIKRFDGSELLRERDLRPFDDGVENDWPPIIASLELGALFNTNVALTPSSRDFAAVRAESAQLVASPKLEYWLYEGDVWRFGPTFAGDFTLNESDFSSLNLQSYRPGAFVERSIFHFDDAVLIPRLQYIYSLDQFDGQTFDDRHQLTLSNTTLWDRGGSTVAYLAANITDFTNDGADPTLTSRDGWTYGAGVNHTHAVGARWLSAVSIGADAEKADVDGSTFAYNGVSAFVATETPITTRLSLILEGGAGYRDYHRAMVTPDRNETIWRGGARLLFRINDYWSVAGVFKYDRFDSDNQLYQSERILTGVVTSFAF